jgi:hypothetical protein
LPIYDPLKIWDVEICFLLFLSNNRSFLVTLLPRLSPKNRAAGEPS